MKAFATAADGQVRLRDLATAVQGVDFDQRLRTNIAISPDGSVFASIASWDIRVVRASDHQVIGEVPRSPQYSKFVSTAFSPDGRYGVAIQESDEYMAAQDHTLVATKFVPRQHKLVVFSATSAERVQTFNIEYSGFRPEEWEPEAAATIRLYRSSGFLGPDRVWALTESGRLEIWDLVSGELLRVLELGLDANDVFAASNDGRHIAVERGGLVEVWDVDIGSGWLIDVACNWLRTKQFAANDLDVEDEICTGTEPYPPWVDIERPN